MTDASPLVAPGDIRAWIDPNGRDVDIRVGVAGGMATASVPATEFRGAVKDSGAPVNFLEIRDAENVLGVIPADDPNRDLVVSDWPISNGNLKIRIGMLHERTSTTDRVVLLLPLLMWILAAIVTWLLVTRLLIRQVAVTKASPRFSCTRALAFGTATGTLFSVSVVRPFRKLYAPSPPPSTDRLGEGS